jgi:bacillithiol system protein YtxJ
MPKQLTTENEINDLIAARGPVWLFKHSNACGVSSAAYEEVENFAATHPDQDVAMVVIQENRPLSNYVSNKLKFVHQSPQLFLLQGGAVTWTATHWGITAQAMAAALTKKA